MTAKPTNPADRPEGEAPSFEDALRRLEAIVEELEHGALSLEDSILRYEEGIGLSRRLTALLEAAEQRIERLVEREPGAPTTEPMNLDPEAGPQAAPRRAEGRTEVEGSARRQPARDLGPPEASRMPERRPSREPADRGDEPPARTTPRGGTEELPF